MMLDCWWKRSLLLLLIAHHAMAFCPSTRLTTTIITTTAKNWPLYSTPPQNKKSASASRQARREEDERRLQRKEDVVIGKTSAKRDAKDLALNPKATEEEWLRQASRIDQQVFKLTEEGMKAFKMLNLEEASVAFDEVFSLKPDAYLWQAGICKYYLGHVKTAANLFAKNAAIYENKFGGKASEERIWRCACVLKLATLKNKEKDTMSLAEIEKANKKLIPLEEHEEDPDSLFKETRPVVRIASDLFEASVSDDIPGIIVARAKLRAIGGSFVKDPPMDLKQRKLQAWFFLGLHYDVMGQVPESIECMKMAMRHSTNTGNGDNILLMLPLIHMCRRGWFDDDDFDKNPLNLLKATPSNELKEYVQNSAPKEIRKMVKSDPIAAESIHKNISNMSLAELQIALLARGLKSAGYKHELQDRLFESLINDVFQPL